MREVKDPDIRRAEILQSAQKLFIQKGYMNVTTQDIVNDLHISRGLLYYHFKSKEDILEHIVDAEVSKIKIALKDITYSEKLSATEKIEQFISATIIPPSANTEENRALNASMRLPENSYMTDRIYRKMAETMAEFFSSILEQGNQDGSFQVDNPKETSVFLMTAYLFTLNSRDFACDDLEVAKQYLNTFGEILSKVVGTTIHIM